MANIYDFSSDKIDIFILILDKSGSMSGDRENVKKGLEMYRKSFENFPEANSIAVSVCRFDEDFYAGDFKHVSDLDITYHTDGGTALYYSIVTGANHLKRYIEEVTERTGCIPRATFILFSDGHPEGDKRTRDDATRVIRSLNYAGITTVFVAFGQAINSDFGKSLEFQATIDVRDRDTLVNFLGVELSKSCKEQSKSLKALGANFFSKAVDGGNSEGYSQTTTQVLEDDSWINEV